MVDAKEGKITKGSSSGATLSFTQRSKGQGRQNTVIYRGLSIVTSLVNMMKTA